MGAYKLLHTGDNQASVSQELIHLYIFCRKEIFPVPLPSLWATPSSSWWPAVHSSSTSPRPPAPGYQKLSAFLMGQK